MAGRRWRPGWPGGPSRGTGKDVMADNTSQQLLDMWKRQVEDGTQAWLRMMGQGPAAGTPPMDPQAFWRPFMDQGMAAWSKGMTQGTAPSPGLMGQGKQSLDQGVAPVCRGPEEGVG